MRYAKHTNAKNKGAVCVCVCVLARVWWVLELPLLGQGMVQRRLRLLEQNVVFNGDGLGILRRKHET